MASVSGRGGKWRVRWRDRTPTGWIDRSITVTSKREADILKAEIELAIAREGRFQPGRARLVAGLEAVITAYVEHCARNLAPRTTIRYGQHLELFTRYLGQGRRSAHLDVSSLSYDVLSAFHAWLGRPETGRHVHRRGDETRRKVVACVEGMWAWAFRRQQRGDWSGVPYPDSLELKRGPTRRKPAPTWLQMDACIAACNDWHRHLAIVLRCTGLRVGQAMGLRWEDVDLADRMLDVRPELGKSSQEKRGRAVPIAPVLAEDLAGWGRRDGWLIRHSGDREPRGRDMARAWKRAEVAERVWKSAPHHCFRAGFESGLKRLGADVEATEYIVGHARGIRDHYVGPDALPLREVVAMVPAIGTSNVRRLAVGEE